MSAITGTVVSNVSLALNTGAELTYAPATNAGTLVTDTETFNITPTKSDRSLLITVKNNCGAAITFSLLKGDMWASTVDLPAVSVASGKTYGITVDTAKYKTSAGVIKVLVTPTAGTALTASSGVGVSCIQI